MPGNHRGFPHLQPGDRLPAGFLNDVTSAVERLEMFGDRVDGLAGGAGTVLRKNPPRGWKEAVFRLEEPLIRTESAFARLMAWDGEDWVDGPGSRTLYGDFFRGYAFAEDLITAVYHPLAARWFALGSGQSFIRGTLDDSLGSNQAATLSVVLYDPDLEQWIDSLDDVTVYEAIGLDDPVAAGTVCFATWHEQAQRWIATHAPCGEAE